MVDTIDLWIIPTETAPSHRPTTRAGTPDGYEGRRGCWAGPGPAPSAAKRRRHGTPAATATARSGARKDVPQPGLCPSHCGGSCGRGLPRAATYRRHPYRNHQALRGQPASRSRLSVAGQEFESRLLIRHFPANLQIHGNRIYIAPPRELRSLRSPPMTRLWRADHVRKAIWQRFPPSRHTSPVFSALPSISSAYAGTGLRRRSSIKAKIFWNKIFDTATSASWNVT